MAYYWSGVDLHRPRPDTGKVHAARQSLLQSLFAMEILHMKVQLAFPGALGRPSSSAIAVATLPLLPQISAPDESGHSPFWVPGLFGALRPVPQTPGWSRGRCLLSTSVDPSGAAAASKEIQVGRFSPTVNVNFELINLNAPRIFCSWRNVYFRNTEVLGGQLAVGVTGIFGRNSTTLDGTLTMVWSVLRPTRIGKHIRLRSSVGRPLFDGDVRWNAAFTTT